MRLDVSSVTRKREPWFANPVSIRFTPSPHPNPAAQTIRPRACSTPRAGAICQSAQWCCWLFRRQIISRSADSGEIFRSQRCCWITNVRAKMSAEMAPAAHPRPRSSNANSLRGRFWPIKMAVITRSQIHGSNSAQTLILEFESYMPSHAVGSARVVIRRRSSRVGFPPEQPR
jgi:hypothetical protein